MILDLFKIAEYLMMFFVLFFTVAMLLIYLRNRDRMMRVGHNTYEPTISVIIPAYNEEGVIIKTVNSVLDADYPKNKMEVLVVNDGSKDKTVDEVNSIKDKRVKLIDKVKNSGKADSLNKGIDKAKGEVIITLDSDSYITKDSIRRLVSYFDKDVAAVTSAVKVREDKDLNFYEKLQRVEYLFTIFNRRLFSMINGVYVTPGPLSAFKKQIFDELGGFDRNNIMEDQEMALRIQSANYRIESCMDAVVYTDVPKDFSSLMRQRERWHRGGFKNVAKYSYMVNPKYGDFGTFVMLYSIASIFLLVLVASLVAISLSQVTQVVFVNPMLVIEPIHVLSAIVLLLTFIWTFVALKEIKDNKTKKRIVVVYTILYCYLITLFMFIAVFKEITGERQVW